MEEWLAYGAARVPALYGELKAGRAREIRSKDLRITAVYTGASIKRNAFQQPQLFDFRRKRREVVVAAAAK